MNTEWIVIISILLSFVVFMILLRLLLLKIYHTNAKREAKRVHKFSDKTLKRRFYNVSKSCHNKFLAIYIMGFFFYKHYLEYLNSVYFIYEEEMLKRGLAK